MDYIAETPNLVFVADGSGRVFDVNEAWVEYTGVDAPHVDRDQHDPPLGIVHPMDRERTWGRWKQALETGEPFEISYRLRAARDGSYRWFLARAVPVRDDFGTITRWVGSATDIDSHVRAGEGGRFLSATATVLASSLRSEQKIVEQFCRLTELRFAGRCSIRLDDEPREASFDDERMIIPMVVVDRYLGSVELVSGAVLQRFDAFDAEIATAAVRQLALAIENARAFERERLTTERFRFLADATDRLFADSNAALNVQGVLEVIAARRADWAALYLIDPGGGIRVDALAHGELQRLSGLDELRNQHPFSHEGERFFQDAVRKRRVRLLADVTPDSMRALMLPYLMPIVAGGMPRSLMLVPLYTPDVDFGALGIYATDYNYGADDVELFEELGRRVSLALEHAMSGQRERRLAQTLQEATLPAQLPVVQGCVLSTAYIPASGSDAQVGGDWYDAFELPSGRFVLSIGDVTGRGLQASVIMGKLRHAINVVALYEEDPARILDAAESIVLQRYPEAIATAFVAIYDSNEQELVFANAGHPLPLVRNEDDTLVRLAAEGLPVGLRWMAEPARSQRRSIRNASLVALYTDGLTEATRDIEQGERQLEQTVMREGILYVRNAATAVERGCLRRGESTDDAALLVLCFPRSVGWAFDADNARAAGEARGGFIDKLRSEAAEGSDFAAAELVFGELVGNVVRHAPGPIDIAFEWKNQTGVLHVVDRGGGFIYRPRKRAELLSEEGRGLWLIGQFGRDVRVERLPGFGTHVRVVLPISKRALGRSDENRSGDLRPDVTSREKFDDRRVDDAAVDDLRRVDAAANAVSSGADRRLERRA
ncbi:MAG: SpoIIE family protein phosphatase [Candidatus Eremiobacteraeota bacterium]|nr:SpoIIE family protein phosphatase [Candidatus Eremiobacteraeota bacterium]